MNVRPADPVVAAPVAKKVVAPAVPALPKRSRQEREFLPAALEILESPPSPARVFFLWLICAMFTAAFAWSWFARIDIHAIAQGRIQISGRSKVVQPLEPGKVRAYFVENGQQVKAGQLLVELDPTETGADVEAQTRDLESFTAEAVRRRAAIAFARSGAAGSPAVDFPPEISPGVRSREESALSADVAQLTSTREALKAQLAERQATQRRLTLSIEARQKLIELLRERVDMREKLVVRDSGTRAAVIDALQALQQEITNLAYDQGQLVEAQAGAVTLERRLEQLVAEFVAQQTDKLTEAERKRDRTRQDLVKSVAKAGRTRLTAPIDGTVQQLAVTTVGQVVTSGQPLMMIVPNEGPIEIEALVLNRDIGFVEPGQEAVVKIESFPYTRYGTLDGKVVRVSRDAIDEREGAGAADATAVARGQAVAPVSGTPKTQNLVFPVTVALSRTTIVIDGKPIPLSPGMTVTVEIRTGDRRVIDYLLAPLRETASEAGHER